jgi:hypothetical protein
MSATTEHERDSGAARAVRVRRLTSTKVWHGAQRGFWETWSARSMSWLVGVYATTALLMLGATFVVSDEPAATMVAVLGHPTLAYALLAWLPINAWLGDRYFALQTPPARHVRPLARGLRAACAGLPLVGLYVGPTWRHLLRHHAARLSVPRTALGLSRLFERPSGDRRAGRIVPGFARIWPLCLPLVLAPLIVWTLALAQARPAWRIGLVAVLQLGAAAAFTHAQWPSQTARARGWLALRLLATFLVPLGAFLWTSPDDKLTARRTRCLTWAAHSRGGSLERLNAWTRLARALRGRALAAPWWHVGARRLDVPSAPHPGLLFSRILALARLKTLTLATLAGSASALLVHAAGDTVWMERAGTVLLAVAGALFVAGCTARAKLFIVRVLRLRRRGIASPRRVWARFAVLVSVALAGGALFGSAVARGQAAWAALATVHGAGFLAMFAAYGLVITPWLARDRAFDDDGRAPWTTVFLLLAFVAALLAAAIHLTCFSPVPFVVVLITSTAADALAAAVYGRDLLRPFRWRHISHPRVAPRMRLRLTLLAVSAVAPFGGVAVPFWFHLRPQPGEVPPEVLARGLDLGLTGDARRP